MAKKMKFKMVIDDPAREERLEIDIDTVDRGIEVLKIFAWAERLIKTQAEGLTREEKKQLLPIYPGRTQLRYAANRIINTKTGEVIKDMPMKAKRAMPKRRAA